MTLVQIQRVEIPLHRRLLRDIHDQRRRRPAIDSAARKTPVKCQTITDADHDAQRSVPACRCAAARRFALRRRRAAAFAAGCIGGPVGLTAAPTIGASQLVERDC